MSDSQLLSPFYRPEAGPEDHLGSTSFNFYDSNYLFSDIQFPNRNACWYLEARKIAGGVSINPSGDKVISSDDYALLGVNDNDSETSNVGLTLETCQFNSQCSDSSAVCLGGWCKSNACDTKYVTITNSTIQDATWNTNDVENNFPEQNSLTGAWGKSNWGQEIRNDDGVNLRSTSGLIFNSVFRNLTTDTILDLQHRDGTSRDPDGFDHVQVERNILANGRIKNTRRGILRTR